MGISRGTLEQGSGNEKEKCIMHQSSLKSTLSLGNIVEYSAKNEVLYLCEHSDSLFVRYSNRSL